MSAVSIDVANAVRPQAKPPLMLSFFGHPQLLPHDGAPLVLNFKYRKASGLLAYLAVQSGKLVRREFLGDLLWPGLDSKAQRGNLRVALADVRRVLAECELDGLLDSGRDWLTLHARPQLLTEMQLLADEQHRRCLQDSPGWMDHLLGNGAQWLAGLEDSTSEEFSEWLTIERARLDKACQQLTKCEPSKQNRNALPPSLLLQDSSSAECPLAEPEPQISLLTLLRVEFEPLGAGLHDGVGVASALAMVNLMQHLREEINAFGGRVLAEDGTGATCVFGEHSEQAAFRSLALRAASNFFQRLPEHWSVRMGICFGPVVTLHNANDGLLQVFGRHVQLVDKLARSAKVGEIVADDSLRDLAAVWGYRPKLARASLGLEPGSPLYGKRFEDISPLAIPLDSGLEVSFVGRQRELKYLHARWEAMLAEGGSQAVCLNGDTGMGKTRLAAEFLLQRQREGARCFWFGGFASGAHAPWFTLHEFVSRLLAGSRHGLRQRIAWLVGERNAGGLTEQEQTVLLRVVKREGISRQDVEPLLSALVKIMQGDGEGTIVVIDDVQWVDQPSAALLRQLAERLCQSMLLLTCRKGMSKQLSITECEELVLPPFDDEEAYTLLRILDVDGSLDERKDYRRVVSNARGVPLVLMADVGKVGKNRFEEWCQVLVNQLGDKSAILGYACLLGMVFSQDDLEQLCGARVVQEVLATAQAMRMVLPRGQRQWSFFHPRLHEYLLGILVPEPAQRFARRAAALLIQQQRYREAAELWEYADEKGPALSSWFDAFQAAIKVDDVTTACVAGSRMAALGYAPGQQGLRQRIAYVRAVMLRDGFGTVDSYQLIAEIESLAEYADDDADMAFEVISLRYLREHGCGDRDSYSNAQQMLDAAHSPVQRMTAYWAMGNALFWRGEFILAKDWLEKTIELGVTLDIKERMRFFPTDPMVFSRAKLGWLLWFLGEEEGCFRVHDEAEKMAVHGLTNQDQVIIHIFRAGVAWSQGDLAELERYGRLALEQAEAEGYGLWHALARLVLMLGDSYQDRPPKIWDLSAQAEEMAQGYRAGLISGRWFVAEAMLASGRPILALLIAQQGIGATEKSEHRYCLFDLWRIKGAAHQALKQHSAARRAFSTARELAEQALADGWLARWQGQLAYIGAE